jgi:lysophospholipid acyltransferase (LPLAT)-like uncharacterized protein
VSRRLQSLQARGLAWYLLRVRCTVDLRIDRESAHGGVIGIFHRWMYGALVASIGRPELALYFWDHPGGRIIVQAARSLGVGVILGGPSNGYGVRAVRKWLEGDGHLLGIAVDGPLGPANVARPGAVRFARLARVPVHPVHVHMGSSFELGTWDRLRVPDCRSTLGVKILPAVERRGNVAQESRALSEILGAQTPSSPSRGRLVDVPLRRFVRLCLAHAPLGVVNLGPRSSKKAGPTSPSMQGDGGDHQLSRG